MTKGENTAYWRQQVDGFQASGLSVKNYCAQEGIAVATLHYWRKRFADAVEPRPMVQWDKRPMSGGAKIGCHPLCTAAASASGDPHP